MLKSLTHPHMDATHAKIMAKMPESAFKAPVQNSATPYPAAKKAPATRPMPAGLANYLAKKKALNVVK